MIRTFGDSETEKIWKGIRSAKLPNNIQNTARRKLRMINNAGTMNDLRIPPANRLEKLKGELKGLHSIRINDQWRITFRWRESHAFEVKIVDYHD
jgi:proteic killer suppression protein